MGCSSCGKRRRTHMKQFDAPLVDAQGRKVAGSFEHWANRKARAMKESKRRRAQADMVGAMIEPYSLKNIISIPRVGGRLNILKNSKEEKAVYIIGHFKGCAACKYMHRLLDRAANLLQDKTVNFYSVEKNDVQPNGFNFRNNPTLVFIDHGKPIREISGMYPDLENLLVKTFSRNGQ